MYSNSMTNENGFSFSQPASDPTELAFASNAMNTKTEASNLIGSGTYHNCGSGSAGYVRSPCSNSMANYSNTFKQSFQRDISCPSPYKGRSEDGAVRRVHSDGDLMENSMIVEGMRKISRYCPEEKWEIIERYRSKRNLRNFKKKTQYECRKILADRRRSKGQFVRNEEISTMKAQSLRNEDMSTMEDTSSHDNNLLKDQYNEGEEDSWINLLDYSSHSQVLICTKSA